MSWNCEFLRKNFKKFEKIKVDLRIIRGMSVIFFCNFGEMLGAGAIEFHVLSGSIAEQLRSYWPRFHAKIFGHCCYVLVHWVCSVEELNFF